MLRACEHPDRVADGSGVEISALLVDDAKNAQPGTPNDGFPLPPRVAQQGIGTRTHIDFPAPPDFQDADHVFRAPARTPLAGGRRVAHDLLHSHTRPTAPPDILRRGLEAVRTETDPDGVDTAGVKHPRYGTEMPDHLRIAGDMADRVNGAEREPDGTGSNPLRKVIEPGDEYRGTQSVAPPGITDHRQADVKPTDAKPSSSKDLKAPAGAARGFQRRLGCFTREPIPEMDKGGNLGVRAGGMENVVNLRVRVEPDFGYARAIASPGTPPSSPGTVLSCLTMRCHLGGHW